MAGPGDQPKTAGPATATTKQRTVVISGTFSIEEIEVAGTSRPKAAKPKKAKAGRPAKAKAGTTAKAKAGSTKPGTRAPRAAKRPAKPKAGKKPAIAKLDPVVLAGQPGIKNIAELKDQLTAALSADAAVIVDASQVQSIDTAALQLLVAFANSMRKQSRTIEWRDSSKTLHDMADLLDLTQSLGMGDGSVAA